MELEKEYKLVGSANLTYGQLRTYAKYIVQDSIENETAYKIKSVYYCSQPSGGWVAFDNATNTLDGTKKTYGYTKMYSGETVMQEVTRTIKHEEDGTSPTKTIVNKLTATFGGSATVTSTITFPKIDRLNQIVVNEGVVFNVDTNENVSNEIPVTITKYVDSYTSKLRITMENNLGEQTVVRNYTDFDGDTLIFTEEELSTIYNNTPNYRIVALIFDLDSYDGETKVGTYTLRQTATLSETDLYPTFNDFEYADTNETTLALTGNSQILVKGYSNVEMSVSETNKAVAHKGATVKQYTFANGIPIQDITTINYPIKTEKFKPQNKELGVTAIDSRDLPVNVVKDLTNIKVSKELVIEWDGYSSGEYYDYLYKVSESTPTQEMLNGATVEMMGETFVLDNFNSDGKNIVAGSSALQTFPVLVGVVTETNAEFPMSPGTYFFRYQGAYYISKLTANINETYNNWVEYTNIEKKPFSAERKNAGTSTQVTLKLSGNIWDGNFGKEDNSIKEAIYKYKKTTDTEWIDGTTTLNVVKDGSSYSLEQDVAGDLGATGFNQEESYDIYVEVSDQLSTISDTFTLGAGSPGIARYKNCVALGAPYDKAIGGRVQIPKVTGETDFVTNLKKQGKEVATKEDIPVGWEDITEKDHEFITYASDINFSYKKMYRIASKFIYFVCAGVKATASTTITIGNINESYRPPLTTYIGGCGPESKPITVSASVNGDIIARLTSAGTWFGFSIMWAIN